MQRNLSNRSSNHSSAQTLGIVVSVALMSLRVVAENVDLPDKGEAFHNQAILAAKGGDLDKAIDLWEQAWKVRGINRIKARKYSKNLCSAYMQRSLRTGGGADVSKSVKYFLESKMICDANPDMVVIDEEPFDVPGLFERAKYAADNGDTDAMTAVGLFLAEGGAGVEKNVDESRKWFEKAANGGSELAMSRLGYMSYQAYKKTKAQKDLDVAYKWHFDAMQKGHPYSTMMCGWYYFNDLIKGKTWKDAKLLWENAAAKGNANAMNYLARMYVEGDKIAGSFENAKMWYEKAIICGSSKAMYELALVYFKTNCPFYSPSKGISLLETAAENGDAFSMNCLGNAYYWGRFGLTEDYKASLKWYEKAAKSGLPESQYMYGVMLYRGDGCEKQHEEGKKWVKKAADAGYLPAKKRWAASVEYEKSKASEQNGESKKEVDPYEKYGY